MTTRATRAKKRPRGRPRKPENTALISALAGIQDAMARRTYAKIMEIYRTHVRVDDLQRSRARMVRVIRGRLEAFPDLVVERLTALTDPHALKDFLAAEIRQTLQDLADGLNGMPGKELEGLGDAEGFYRGEAWPPKPTRSRTLAEARSQAAQLKTLLMDLRSRIVRS